MDRTGSFFTLVTATNLRTFTYVGTKANTNFGFLRCDFSTIEASTVAIWAKSCRSSKPTVKPYWTRGMSSSPLETHAAVAKDVATTDDTLTVTLMDGRSISVPLDWYPRLLHGSPEERDNWQPLAKGQGIHWPALDEDIRVDDLLLGRPSGESAESLKKWLLGRRASN